MTTRLLHTPNFRWLWLGQGVSQLGAQFTMLALPVLAVSLLGATEWQIGALNAAETAAFLIVGLPAGAWVDRLLKRRTMIAADLVRVVALGSVPVLWFAGSLEMWHLYIVGAIVGVATVFFDVSYQSYIPILLPGEQIGDANSKLEATAQVARIGGPGLAGALLTIVSAPVLLIADAVSYLVSAVAIWRIADTEPPVDTSQRESLPKEIAEGVRFVFAHRLLRAIVGTTATSNLFSTIAFTLAPILILRELDLGPVGLGVAMSAGAVGGLVGAVTTPWVTRLIGEGTAIVVSAIVGSIAIASLPLAAVFPAIALPILAVGEFITLYAVLVYNITQVTMRQRLCPPRLLGRMNASIRFVVWGVMPIASLIAGALGTVLGLLPTLWIAVVGGLFSFSFVLFSPLTTMRTLPRELVAEGHPHPQPTPDAGDIETAARD